jgi:Xaa-Pro aminopeptidase
MNLIPHSELLSRRTKIVESMLDNSVFILFSGEIVNRNADVEYPFRQDSNFWYLTGFDEPNSALFITKKNGVVSQTLFVQGRDKAKEIWTGRQYSVEEATEITGVERVEKFDSLVDNRNKSLEFFLNSVSTVYFDLKGSYQKIRDQIQDIVSCNQRRSFSENIFAIQKTSTLINPLRLIKSQWEIDQLQISSDIAIDSHLKIAKRIATEQGLNETLNENNIEADLYYNFKNNGVTWSYPAIVATGSNACTLHYIKNDQPIVSGDLVLVDAGCEYGYYASDITRCYPAGGKFSQSQKQIYNLVLKAQLECIAELGRAGATTISFHNKAIEILTQGLIGLGILTGTLEANIENKTYLEYFMHGTGHFLGLDVHDVGAYKNLDGSRAEVKILEGMVLTVEPGLYFDPENSNTPEQYRGIGVRIEDNIVITQNGTLNLTQKLPKMVEELEGLFEN